MATDGLSLYACIRELQGLTNGRIDKVQQPNKDILILHVHCATLGRVRLMLCIHAENGRIQLVSHGFENPETPPSFCMLLRKYLIGARIAEIAQAGMNRVAVFSLYGRNEFQDEIQMKLVVELMGADLPETLLAVCIDALAGAPTALEMHSLIARGAQQGRRR